MSNAGLDSSALFERLATAAREMNRMDPFGALHIFVEDGNCADEDLDFCLQEANITADEAAWCKRMRMEFNEDERIAVFRFSDCADLR